LESANAQILYATVKEKEISAGISVSYSLSHYTTSHCNFQG